MVHSSLRLRIFLEVGPQTRHKTCSLFLDRLYCKRSLQIHLQRPWLKESFQFQVDHEEAHLSGPQCQDVRTARDVSMEVQSSPALSESHHAALRCPRNS